MSEEPASKVRELAEAVVAHDESWRTFGGWLAALYPNLRKEIQATARDAVAAAKRVTPQRAGPFRIRIRYHNTEIPEVAEILPGIERPEPDVLAFSSSSMADAFRLYRVLYRYINPQ